MLTDSEVGLLAMVLAGTFAVGALAAVMDYEYKGALEPRRTELSARMWKYRVRVLCRRVAAMVRSRR